MYFYYSSTCHIEVPQPPALIFCKIKAGFRLFPFRSPLLGESRPSTSLRVTLSEVEKSFDFFSSDYLDVSVHLVSLHTSYGFAGRFPIITSEGLPHSETPGSLPVCGSPRHIGAYPVLHRLINLVILYRPLVAWPFLHQVSIVKEQIFAN